MEALTDKDFEFTKSRIKKAIFKWSNPCGLRMWRDVTFVYHRSTVEMSHAREVELTSDHKDTAGCTYVDWQYKEATVHLNVEKLATMHDDNIDYTIRHEIAHLLLHEMREWKHYDKDRGSALMHEERVATEIACIIGWVFTAGQDDARKKKRKR